EPELAPVVVIGGLAAHVDHGVDGRGAADHLAARIVEAAAVEPLLRLGLEHPVRARVADGEEVAHRDVEPDQIVLAAGFEQQHARSRIGGEPVRQHAAGRPRADDDVVVFAFEWCCLGHAFHLQRRKLGALPLPFWGEGWGEGVTELSRELSPSPQPSPSRSRIYPTSADLKSRTRVNPSSVGEGADRVHGANSDPKQARVGQARRPMVPPLPSPAMLLGLRRGPWRAVSAPLPRNGASGLVAFRETCGRTTCRSAARYRAGAPAAARSARMPDRTLMFLAALALGVG